MRGGGARQRGEGLTFRNSFDSTEENPRSRGWAGALTAASPCFLAAVGPSLLQKRVCAFALRTSVTVLFCLFLRLR